MIFRLALISIALLAVSVPQYVNRRAATEQRVADRMRAYAGKITDPVGATPLPASACPGALLVRCVHSGDDLDTTAAALREQLSAVTATRATMSCRDVGTRESVTYRSCQLRHDEGGHSVVISVDTEIDMTSGHPVRTGIVVRYFAG